MPYGRRRDRPSRLLGGALTLAIVVMVITLPEQSLSTAAAFWGERLADQ